MVTTLSFLFFTYFLSGCALFLALQRVVRLPTPEVPRFFWLSLGAGPVAISWVVIVSMHLVPGLAPLAYVVLAQVFVITLGAVGWPARNTLQTVYADLMGKIRSLSAWTGFEWFLGLLLVTLVCANLFLALILPIVENDAIQYVLVSQMILERGSLALYPVIEPDPRTGFYAVSSHPLGFMGLYLWTFMAQGGTEPLALIKLVSPAYVFYSLLALAAFHWNRARLVIFTAGLVLLATPAYFLQSVFLSIDSFRIYLLLAAAAWLLETARRADRHAGLKWGAGLFCGLSMFSHSVNLIFTVPLLGLGYLAVAAGPLLDRLRTLIVVALAATVVGGERLVSNLLQFGLPVYDFFPVYEMEFLRHTEHVWGSVGMVTMWDRVVRGLLRGWTALHLAGFSYWIFLAALVGWVCGWPVSGWAKVEERMLIVVIGGFYLLAAATVMVGSPVFVTNYRYMVTVQPFIASIGAVFLVAVYERYRNRA